MKKFLFVVVLLSMIASSTIYGNKRPTSVCLHDPSRDTGHCELLADGSGYACVLSISYKPIDCFGNLTVSI